MNCLPYSQSKLIGHSTYFTRTSKLVSIDLEGPIIALNNWRTSIRDYLSMSMASSNLPHEMLNSARAVSFAARVFGHLSPNKQMAVTEWLMLRTDLHRVLHRHRVNDCSIHCR